MEEKRKRVSLMAVLVVGLFTAAPVACEHDESLLPETETTTTTDFETTTPRLTLPTTTKPYESPSELIISKKKSDLARFGFYDKKKAERGLKPFVYGKKFELQNEFSVNFYGAKGNAKQEKLFSPLITTPIRIMPYPDKSSQLEKTTLQRERNASFLGKNDESKTSTEGELTTNTTEKKDQASSKTRQNGDRSLMVVLPFNPSDNGSVEELFTKKPLVRMMETDDLLKRKEDNKGPTTEFFSPTANDPATTTEFDRKTFLTRKPWRPSKRPRFTTETYPSTTESGEDATKTYTTYNDVEQVTRKFQISPGLRPATNHNYDVVTVPSLRSGIKTAPVRDSSFDGNAAANSSDESPNTRKTYNKVLEILPAHMKDVMLELNLNEGETAGEGGEGSAKNPTGDSSATTSKHVHLKTIVQPPIDPKSYAIFKPIPLEIKDDNKNVVSEDMKTFLASFGLLPEPGKRQQKSLKAPRRKPSQPNLNFLPDDMKSLLRDMGLVKYSGDSLHEPSIHIFNPNNHSIAQSDEDLEKLKTILTSIKATLNESKSLAPEMHLEIIEKINNLNDLRYKAANLTEINDAVKKILTNLPHQPEDPATTQKTKPTKLSEGPNPLLFSDENLTKNDVKRQTFSSASAASSSASSSSSASNIEAVESSTSGSRQAEESSTSGSRQAEESSTPGSRQAVESSSSDDDSSSTTTTTEESPNLEALKESFGGGETASDAEDVDSALPPKRPNGLYFLFDWNSFLEVGTEDDRRRVNLRFQPKIGDSRNFLPVTIP